MPEQRVQQCAWQLRIAGCSSRDAGAAREAWRLGVTALPALAKKLGVVQQIRINLQVMRAVD